MALTPPLAPHGRRFGRLAAILVGAALGSGCTPDEGALAGGRPGEVWPVAPAAAPGSARAGARPDTSAPESDRATPPPASWPTAAGPAHLDAGVFEAGTLRVDGVYDTPALCASGAFAVLPVEDVGAALSPAPPAGSKADGVARGAGLVHLDLSAGVVRPLLAEGGRPDRPWLDPSCETLVFAWAPRGLVGLWRLDLAARLEAPDEPTHTAPVALTNAGLLPTPGRAPEGFVPPPRRGSLRLDGHTLRWEAEDGAPHQAPAPFVAGAAR